MKKRIGLFGSIVLREDGPEKLSMIYRPILLWLFLFLFLCLFGFVCAIALLNFPDFRLFAGVSSLGFIFFVADVLKNIGSVVELNFDKKNASLVYRRQLFNFSRSKSFKLRQLVRVEVIARPRIVPTICLLFTIDRPIYIPFLFGRVNRKAVGMINDFLNCEN